MADAVFRREQRGVAVRMAVAMAASIASIGGALAWGTDAPLSDRLEIATVAALLPVLWLAVAIANVARLRFFSPDDIAGSDRTDGSARIRTASAILQNTLEQTALALPTYGIAAAMIDRAIGALIAAATLFTLGRLLFWRGHAGGASARALGFALTFYPTLALLVAVIAMFAFKG